MTPSWQSSNSQSFNCCWSRQRSSRDLDRATFIETAALSIVPIEFARNILPLNMRCYLRCAGMRDEKLSDAVRTSGAIGIIQTDELIYKFSCPSAQHAILCCKLQDQLTATLGFEFYRYNTRIWDENTKDILKALLFHQRAHGDEG